LYEFVHCSGTADAQRTVVMQAGINGYGFVLRNSLGNICFNVFRD